MPGTIKLSVYTCYSSTCPCSQCCCFMQSKLVCLGYLDSLKTWLVSSDHYRYLIPVLAASLVSKQVFLQYFWVRWIDSSLGIKASLNQWILLGYLAIPWCLEKVHPLQIKEWLVPSDLLRRSALVACLVLSMQRVLQGNLTCYFHSPSCVVFNRGSS